MTTVRGRAGQRQRASLVLAGILSTLGCGRTGLEVGDLAEPPLLDGGEGAPCPTGFADCDRMGRCATDLGASSENCGACGNACPEGLVCGAGVCRSPEDIVQVAAGLHHTCALRASGEVLCWGGNHFGELGDGTFEGHTTPMPVVGLADAVQIDSAEGPTAAVCARRASGTLSCWGLGDDGQLGNGSEEDQPVPVDVVGVVEAASVATTWGSACALLRDGSVWCWGSNEFGGLGNGTTESPSTAAPVVDLGRALQLDVGPGIHCVTLPSGEVACWGYDPYRWAGHVNIVPPAIAKNVSDAASVWLATPYCVIHAGGAVSCTGFNEYGNIDADLPYDLTNGEMIAIDGVTDAIQVVGTLASTCALRANGQVVCWGFNNVGVLGTGSFDQPDEKIVTVSGLEGAVHLAAGRWHVCAALGSRGVACWGANQAGQLGDGTTEDRASPVPVLGLP